MTTPAPERRGGAAALMVGAGIFLSRIAGFVRTRALAHYLGTSDAADAFGYALRIPNMLQNLFGEGVLSASFIPVYARLLEEKREEEARRVAGAVATLLVFIMAVVVLVGVMVAPVLVDLFALGYSGEKREVLIRLVRITFPGTGLLVMSAWCLGVLNSHRRFFLSYVAPVLWNAAIIAALIYEGRSTRHGYSLATAAAWGAVAGSALQLMAQLPMVLVLLRGFRPGLGAGSAQVRQVGTSFLPVVVGRGVVQLSSWLDGVIVSLLFTGAMAGLVYAQMLYQLPIGLFGMAISASELPEMARAMGDEQAIAAQLRERLSASLRRMAFLVIPSAVVFLALGDMVVGLVYRTGRFGAGDTLFVWAILAGFAVGLFAATQGRLYSSAFYALRDTLTPFRIALVRVAVGAAVGAGLAFGIPQALGIERRWGVVGLALGGGVAAWVEMWLLRRRLGARIGERVAIPAGFAARAVLAAAVGAAAGWGLKVGLPLLRERLPVAGLLPAHPAFDAALVLAVFGATYLAAAGLFGLPEARALTRRVLGRFSRRRSG
jgi:putative peptidoglycan lipid II flippase